MFCLSDKLRGPVSITGKNWTKTERKIRETTENGLNCQNEMELSKMRLQLSKIPQNHMKLNKIFSDMKP